MKRNRNLPFWHPWYPDPKPGFLYCCMENVLGWGRGSWIVQVIIDLQNNEYNTSVKLSGPYKKQLPESKADEIEKEGIELTEKEIGTIVKLYKSWRFRYFISHNFSEQWEDVGRTYLELFTIADTIRLSSHYFDFFQRNSLPNNKFRRGAWWWTRGLRHISGKISSYDKPQQDKKEFNRSYIYNEAINEQCTAHK